jgi:hypothetical protein
MSSKTKEESQVAIPTANNTTLFIDEDDVKANLKSLKRKDPLKVIFFGTPEFVVPVLETLHTHFHLKG